MFRKGLGCIVMATSLKYFLISSFSLLFTHFKYYTKGNYKMEYIRIDNVQTQLINPMVQKNNAWTSVFNVGTKKFRLTTSNIESDAPYEKSAADFIVREAVIIQNGVGLIPTRVRYYWDNGTYIIDIYQISGV